MAAEVNEESKPAEEATEEEIKKSSEAVEVQMSQEKIENTAKYKLLILDFDNWSKKKDFKEAILCT